MLDQQSGETVMNSGWCVGECIRSNKKGDFPAECVYVLPTITKPPMEILVSHLNNCILKLTEEFNGSIALSKTGVISLWSYKVNERHSNRFIPKVFIFYHHCK